jgi:hypothetical protein
MDYRHFRFFRSATTGHVRMQNTSNISSWGDTTDKWRGLDPLTHYTEPFVNNNGLGVPDLWAAFKENAMPKALVRSGNAVIAEEVVKSLHKLHEACPAFGEDELKSNLAVADLYSGERAVFPWSEEDVTKLFQKRAFEAGGPKNKLVRSDGALPEPCVGQCYILRPEPDTDPFVIGICRAVSKTRGKTKAYMQYFQQVEGADPYEGQYTSVLTTDLANTRYPVAEELQYQLNKISRVRQDSKGHVKSFYLPKQTQDKANIRWYVEEWENGPDLRDRPHERTLRGDFLH